MTTTKQPALPELLPCPFCGSPAEALDAAWIPKAEQAVNCTGTNCDAASYYVSRATWNTRADERERAGREGGWLPIESAPDNIAVLLAVPEFIYNGKSIAPAFITTGITKYGPGGFQLVEAGGMAEYKDVYPIPTHWQPLPQPPTAPKEAE